MKKRDRTYCYHILECIEIIQETANEGKEQFLNDIKTHDTIMYRLQIMSESTKRLSDELKNEMDTIPWDVIVGFRNKLVHDYLGIQEDMVWEIVVNYIPELKQAVNAVVEKYNVQH